MLRARGVKIVDPDEGYLACGMTGAGRLASQEADRRRRARRRCISSATWKAERVLITAGPTCEDSIPCAI